VEGLSLGLHGCAILIMTQVYDHAHYEERMPCQQPIIP